MLPASTHPPILRSRLRHGLALLLFTAPALPAATFASQLASPTLWQPGNVPFSFHLGDQDSTKLLPAWTFSEVDRPDPAGHTTIYRYTDPATGLEVEADRRSFPDFPEVSDWVLHFRNNGQQDSPVLEDILPLDWTVPASPGELTLRHAKGSDASAGDFQPLLEHIAPGATDHLESVDGLPSSRNTLPFFNLEIGDHGLVAAIGWTGNWKADVTDAVDGKSIHLTAGMQKTHLVLHAGEEIRTPRIVLMSWQAQQPDARIPNTEAWITAQNRWRQVLLAHYTPKENGSPMRGPIQFGSWGSEAIDSKLAYTHWVAGQRLPLNLYAVDAGWYAGSIGAESDPSNPHWVPWYTTRGDWFPSPVYYPHGLQPLGDQLKADGLGFSLWIEPETAMDTSAAVPQHPTWFLTRPPHPGVDYPGWMNGRLLNLGDPEARQAITKTVSGILQQNHVTWFRQDFNIPPLPYWEHTDTPDRIGITEIRHVEGLYRMWDDLLAANPGLHIDNCASGGRRIDIEMMSRSFIVWRTDFGVANAEVTQAQTTALAPWVPEVEAFETYTGPKPWTKPPPYDTPDATYHMRSGYDTGLGTAQPGDPQTPNPQWMATFKTALEEYKTLQPFFYADFYPVLPYTLADDAWTAWQWDRPAQQDGIVLLLRRPKSTLQTLTLANLHITPDASYQVELRSGYDHQPPTKMKGSDLLKLQVHLDAAPASLLILYHREN